MITLYKPVKITGAEQAEALPDGSMAFEDGQDAYGRPSRSAAVKHRGAWWADDRELPVIGWTALVPIEARRQEGWDRIDPDFEGAPSGRAHRYVTPWQERE